MSAAASGLVQLDTNVLVHLVRGNAVARQINQDLSLTDRQERPVISVVTVGEMYALAAKFGWGPPKLKQLASIIRQLVVVHLHQGEVISRYAEISHFTEREHTPARQMGQNDMWIAATASAFDAILITADGDFDHLSPRFLRRVRVDGRTGVIIAS